MRKLNLRTLEAVHTHTHTGSSIKFKMDRIEIVNISTHRTCIYF